MKYLLTIACIGCLSLQGSSALAEPHLVSYMIALKQTGFPEVEDYLLNVSDPNSPQWGNYWTREQIMDYVSPSQQQKQPLLDWLKVNNAQCADYGDALQCLSSPRIVAKISSRFDIVDFIEGPKEKPTQPETPSGHNSQWSGYMPDSRYVAREVLSRLYNTTNNTAAAEKASVASIEYQDDAGFSPIDLAQTSLLNGEPAQKVTTVVGQNVGTDLESQLDIQMEALMAPSSELWFWDEANWLYSFAVKFMARPSVPEVISMSWGWAEDSQCDIISCQNVTSEQYVNRVNREYAKIGLRGITILVASGDAGAPGRTSEQCIPERPLNPVLPGSSPWVTSVSATFVNQSQNLIDWETPVCQQQGCATGLVEAPTNSRWTGWTTGGGFAIYPSERQPKWQQPAVKDYFGSGVPLPSNFSREGRGYPDVSAIGHNCLVVSQGSLEGVDGTSCSSPIWAGIVATFAGTDGGSSFRSTIDIA